MGRKDNPVKELVPLVGETEAPWLWIGTWSMGGVGFGPHDEPEARKVLKKALSEGITHFDTAPVYGKGLSEKLLGSVIKKHRQKVFLCTKGGLRIEGKRVVHDARPESLAMQLKESLNRLRTDYIDLYLLHWPDPEVPLSESIEALKDLKEKGHIRHWGVSNLSKEEIMTFLKGERALPHQLHFSPLCRDYELLEISSRYCINCITSPLEQGLLTDSRVSQGLRALSRRDLRRKNPHFQDRTVIEWVEGLKELTMKRGLPTAVSVLLWTGAQEHVHALVVGPRRVHQLEEVLFLKEESKRMGLFSERGIFSPEPVREYLTRTIWDYIERGPW